MPQVSLPAATGRRPNQNAHPKSGRSQKPVLGSREHRRKVADIGVEPPELQARCSPAHPAAKKSRLLGRWASEEPAQSLDGGSHEGTTAHADCYDAYAGLGGHGSGT
jgi:hypothetical protein